MAKYHTATRFSLLTALAAVGAVWVSQPAPAQAFECEGNFQITDGRRHATPYCEDLNIVRVAREYGIRVSLDAIRFNPGKVEQVCRVIGDDLRVKGRCQNYLPDTGRDSYQ